MTKNQRITEIMKELEKKQPGMSGKVRLQTALRLYKLEQRFADEFVFN